MTKKISTLRGSFEARLRESEDRFRIMADGAPAYLWMAGTDARCNFFNQAWLSFTGRTMQQEVGYGWTEGVHPEDFQRCVDTYMQAFNRRQAFTMDYRLRRADGEYRWILDNGIPRFLADSVFAGYIGSCIDITERKRAEVVLKQSEEQYHTLAETIPQIVWTGTADGQMDYFNRRWLDYTGLTSEESQGLGWQRALHAEDTKVVMANWQECVQAGRSLEVECRLQGGEDSGHRWFLVRAQPIRTIAGEVIKWFGTCTDIDEQKRVSRLKDEFLATVSHELRTPLNIILGHASLLANDKQNPREIRETAAVIQRHARIQTRLISDLLDASSILSGKMCIDSDTVDLSAVIKEGVESLRLAAEARQLVVESTLPEAPLAILGDSHRLQQVVRNLVANAIKFTPSPGLIKVSAEQNGEAALLTVTDTGRGMDPRYLPYVFERFSQEDGSIRRQFGGMGLGLSIVREIVELHGGKVGIESDGRGKGTKVVVTFPLQSAKRAGAEGLPYSPSEEGPAVSHDA